MTNTTARYAHLHDDPLRKATERVGAIIEGAGKAGAEMVPIEGRARGAALKAHRLPECRRADGRRKLRAAC